MTRERQARMDWDDATGDNVRLIEVVTITERDTIDKATKQGDLELWAQERDRVGAMDRYRAQRGIRGNHAVSSDCDGADV